MRCRMKASGLRALLLTCNLAVAAMQAGEKVLALDLSAGGSASAFEGCSGFEPMFNMAGS
jgi:hypothetical protein